MAAELVNGLFHIVYVERNMVPANIAVFGWGIISVGSIIFEEFEVRVVSASQERHATNS